MLLSNIAAGVMREIGKRHDAPPHRLMTHPLNQKTSRQTWSASSVRPLKNLNKKGMLSPLSLLLLQFHNTSLKRRRKKPLKRPPEKIDLPNFAGSRKR